MTPKNVKSIQMIIVDSDGEIITAANGRVSSNNPALVKIVKELAAIGMEVQLIQPFGDYFRANLDTKNPIGIVAALFSVNPGRTRLLEAPDEVWEQLKGESLEGTCGHNVETDEEGLAFESMSWEERELSLAFELFGDLDNENIQEDNK